MRFPLGEFGEVDGVVGLELVDFEESGLILHIEIIEDGLVLGFIL
jgi:hypothetical protein